ncbi:family 1 encapsulin nanocompartment shell protein [Nocardioides sp. KR10-350]|uniref:family 1 encapsulin nanocompartment shell protein n=1 Tax=Nocardioides cheoyonin TaxID=3156615 RepID=UPI0032B35133
MNNLHRELAPITEAAWAEIEEEARRTFTRWIAGRRVIDVIGPEGTELAAVGTGHLQPIDAGMDGVITHQRMAQLLMEMRVPFRLERSAVDDVERGAQDSDWQPVKDAAQKMALAEDRAIFHGSAAAGITGLVASSSNAPLSVASEARQLPDTVAKALTALRLVGVDGPYNLLLSAELYTAVSETTDQGYPILHHLARLLDSDIIWAPALDGAVLLTTRGGDYALHLGQDLSIGYHSHDDQHVELYLQESLTFAAYTAEASVPLPVH